MGTRPFHRSFVIHSHETFIAAHEKVKTEMSGYAECGTTGTAPADRTVSGESMNPPAPLAATVQVGLIVAEHHFTAGPVLEAIKTILLRLEATLSVTPHTYQFILVA